jgi:diguanylate cyclase (GGDEF)-like protein
MYEASLYEIAARDSLTGAYTRREFMSLGTEAFSELGNSYRDISVLMLDIDHFKEINDQYGHSTGDKNLQAFVKILSHSLRVRDIIGRLGGEEFAIILVETDEATAFDIAERIRAQVEEVSKTGRDGVVPMTVSIGVEHVKQGFDLEAVLNRVDKMLYEAKSTGRNKVMGAELI